MSNNQMISVPRGTVENAAELLQEYNKCSIARDLRAILDKPAEQHQGDPVALPARKPWNGLLPTADNLKGEGYNACLDELAKLGPLYTRPAQGEAINLAAVATLVDDGDGGLEASWLLEGGTAELFAGMTLLVADNAPDLCAEDGSAQVYTHADPAEVERLRAGLRNEIEAGDSWKREAEDLRTELENSYTVAEHERLVAKGQETNAAYIKSLRAQLAERDALLREIHDGTLSGYARYSKIEAVLSASAQPQVKS